MSAKGHVYTYCVICMHAQLSLWGRPQSLLRTRLGLRCAFKPRPPSQAGPSSYLVAHLSPAVRERFSIRQGNLSSEFATEA
ncbi:hypothetical protein FKM82_022744 [Ascaphus truei]